MKKVVFAFGITLALASGTTLAASHEHHHGMAQESVAIHTGTGVLKAINAKANKVQITHEAIAALAWPAMTMWFTLKEALPQNLKEGDAVQFEMMQGENKQWVIVKIVRKQ